MGYQLQRVTGTIDGEPAGFENLVRTRLDRLIHTDRARYRRLWAYYRNPMRPCPAAGSTPESGSDRPYRQAQEWGLPPRITGVRCDEEIASPPATVQALRKEVVIENDIAWRIDTQVDYLFGKPLVIASAAPDPARREIIGQLLRLILASNGGILFLQQMALLGTVYGFVDVLVKLQTPAPAPAPAPHSPPAEDDTTHEAALALGAGCGGTCGIEDLGQPATGEPGVGEDGMGRTAGQRPASEAEILPPGTAAVGSGPGGAALDPSPDAGSDDRPVAGARTPAPVALEAMARMIRLEIVEPARALPLLSPWDYRLVQAYGQVYSVRKSQLAGAHRPATIKPVARWSERLGLAWLSTDGSVGVRTGGPSVVEVLEIISPHRWQRYEDERLVAEGRNSLGEIPLVHIQNTAVPFEYAGQSDVEGLIPLQDELNTRLSDRANRITMQSFKMYLGRGIENFTELPVAPGRMWMSDNDRADVVEFGGDGPNPSEDAHIADIRDALDKASGVTPVAAGAIKNKIGRLTSAAALRVTLLALLAKTDRKRTSYGRGLERLCELALAWLDKAGVFPTTPAERRVELHWPSPLPENDLEKLQEAEIKRRLGVSEDLVLRELGY